MSDLAHCRGRRLAASAVAFLLPARHDVPFVIRTTPQTCTPRISSVPPPSAACPDNTIAARRLLTTGRGSTRSSHYRCFGGGGGGGSALFAAAAQNDEDKEARSLSSSQQQQQQQQIDPDVHDPTNTEPLPGGPGRTSGRIAEPPRGPSSRWKRLRSTRAARALGRVFRGRSGLAEELGSIMEEDALNSVVSGQVCMCVCRPSSCL